MRIQIRIHDLQFSLKIKREGAKLPIF
jgi:hypothetical protein